MADEVYRQKLSIKGRRHRTLDERLTVLAPGLMRRFGALLLRLPRRSRMRRLLSGRIFSGNYEAVNRRDYELILARCDPYAEWVLVGDAKPPGMDSVYSGRAEAVGMFDAWFGEWDELLLEPQELIDAGGNRFVVTMRQRGRGRGSGVELDVPRAQLTTLRDGAAIRIETFTDPADALAAAGIPRDAAQSRVGSAATAPSA